MKPRLTYAAFVAAKKSTVAQVIARFIAEMDGTDGKPPVRTLGLSHRYTLKRLMRSPIGLVTAAELEKAHVITHCRERQASGTLPQTVMQDITYLTGALKYAGSAWDDCEEVSDAAIAAAKPFLAKHNLICKSTPRDRRPTPEEIERLIEYFSRPTKRNRRRIDMVRMTLWQWYSAMRVGNSCQVLWADWNREEQTILVRKMKDPKRRNKAKVVALTKQAQQFLIALEETRDPNEPRIHPYRDKSVGAAYTRAKQALNIPDLHLHDSRRDRGTRLVEDDGCTSAQAICYTGHETVAVYERTYLRQDAAKVVRQVNAQQVAAVA